MDSKIMIKDYSNGPVEICEDLCNKLMHFQAEQAHMRKDILLGMTFESRLKPSFENAKTRLLLVAFDDEKPIGYVFANASETTEGAKKFRPKWWEGDPNSALGFFPEWLEVPCITGCVNNVYVLPEYQGLGIGRELLQRADDWLYKVDGIKYSFVYVSNGNDADKVYSKFGYKFSHEVFNGFITAYYKKME